MLRVPHMQHVTPYPNFLDGEREDGSLGRGRRVARVARVANSTVRAAQKPAWPKYAEPANPSAPDAEGNRPRFTPIEGGLRLLPVGALHPTPHGPTQCAPTRARFRLPEPVNPGRRTVARVTGTSPALLGLVRPAEPSPGPGIRAEGRQIARVR